MQAITDALIAYTELPTAVLPLGNSNAAPTGDYKGTVTELGQTVNAEVNIVDDATANIILSGAIAVDCEGEAYTFDGASTIDIPGAGTAGDCVHDSLDTYKATLEGIAYDGDSDKITVTTKVPLVGSIAIELSKAALLGDAEYIPTVFMHGLGDSGSNRGMKNLAKTVSDTYSGAYSVAVEVADGLSSYTQDIEKQVAEFAAAVQGDENLAKGFNAVGLSQGGLIVRAYVEQYNDPPVHNLVSMCGPQSGVGDCPGGTPSWMCNIGKDIMYGAGFSFSGYWKDAEGDAATAEANYLDKSTYLADINNDREEKNQTYVDNMLSVNKYVMVEALNDTVVIPHASEQHGFYVWGDLDTIETEKETEGFQNDFIGLKTLDGQGKIDSYTYEGDHLRWSDDFWTNTILPYLGEQF